MSEYSPDRWAVIKITSPDFGEVYKIIGSWYGGYLGSNSWKLSSGIKSNNRLATHYKSLQFSGSTYLVGKENYGMSGYTMGVVSDWIEKLKETPSVIVLILDEIDGISYMDSV